MPPAFSSIQEAEPYFFLIIRRTLHLLNARVARNRNITVDGDLEKESDMYLGESWQSLFNSGLDRHILDMYRWKAAFQPVSMEASKYKASQSHVRALILNDYANSVISRLTSEEQHDVAVSCHFHHSYSPHCSENMVKMFPAGLYVMSLPCMAAI